MTNPTGSPPLGAEQQDLSGLEPLEDSLPLPSPPRSKGSCTESTLEAPCRTYCPPKCADDLPDGLISIEDSDILCQHKDTFASASLRVCIPKPRESQRKTSSLTQHGKARAKEARKRRVLDDRYSINNMVMTAGCGSAIGGTELREPEERQAVLVPDLRVLSPDFYADENGDDSPVLSLAVICA